MCSIRWLLLSGVLLVAWSTTLQAAHETPAARSVAAAEVQPLRAAYMTLYVADHDYHGHRIRAMHALEKACDLLGANIRGDGRAHEQQAISDEQLGQARQTVEQVLQRFASGKHSRVAKHLR